MYIIFCIFHIITFRSGEYNLSFPVLVVQINVSKRVKLPEDGKVSLVFNIPEVVNYLLKCSSSYVCISLPIVICACSHVKINYRIYMRS